MFCVKIIAISCYISSSSSVTTFVKLYRKLIQKNDSCVLVKGMTGYPFRLFL